MNAVSCSTLIKVGIPHVRPGRFWRDHPRRNGRDLQFDVCCSGGSLLTANKTGGCISSMGVTNVLVSTICSTNIQGCTEEEGKAQAKKVFAALDIDKDGRVGMEEFITVGK